MNKGSLYILCYAGILGAVCAFLLTAAAEFTLPYREANAKAEEVRNILSVLKVPFKADASSKQLVEIFNANIQEQVEREKITYVYKEQDTGQAGQPFVVPFSGQGLWGHIKGFLAMEPDRKTIRGITFYEQEETPGLGGEIGSSWFREQFIGKLIVDENGRPGIIIRRSTKAAPNQVDAITGATMTCEKVEAMLNEAIVYIVGSKDNE